MSEQSFVVHVFGMTRDRGAVTIPLMKFVTFNLAQIQAFGEEETVAFERRMLGEIRAILMAGEDGPGADASLELLALHVLSLQSTRLTEPELAGTHGFVVQAGNGFLVEPFPRAEAVAFDARINDVRERWGRMPGIVHVDPTRPAKAVS